MKKFILPVFFVCFALAAFSQDNTYLKGHIKEVQKVLKTDKGVLRGYDFGTPAETIRKTEDALYVADSKTFLLYKVALNEKEYAEIIYYLDENQKVKGFGIAFIENINDVKLEKSLIDDFQKYFNDRYGKFKTNEKNDEVWASKDGSYMVEMGDSSEGGDLIEIEIEIYQKK